MSKGFNNRLNIILEDLSSKMDLINRAFGSTNPSHIAKIELLKSEVGTDDNQELGEYIANFDPTAEKSYLLWIIRTYLTTNIKLPEDGDRLTKALGIFHAVKKQPRYSDEKDINKLRSLEQLETIVSKYKTEGDEPVSKRGFKEYIKRITPKYMKELLSDELFKFYKVEPADKKIESILVSTESTGNVQHSTWLPVTLLSKQEVENIERDHVEKKRRGFKDEISESAYVLADFSCKGTTWCVANPKMADTYLKAGPMFILLKRMVDEGQPIGWSPHYLATGDFKEVMSGGGTQKALVMPSYRLAIFHAKLLSDEGIRQELEKKFINGIRSQLLETIERATNDDRLDDKKRKDLIGFLTLTSRLR